MECLIQDVRHALRGLRRRPGFTVLAVLTLALGIGGATTMFSVIHNVLIDPFPYVDASQVVMPQVCDARRPDSPGRPWFNPREFLAFAAQTQVFSDVIGSAPEDLLYTTPGGTERLTATLCSGNMFEFLGVPALLGRGLTPEDAVPGKPPVFAVRYAFWLSRLGGDPQALGRTFILNGIPYTLVGVMPPRFMKGNGDLYLATAIDPSDPAVRDRSFRFQARLRSGVSLLQAGAVLDAFAHQRAKVHPEDYPPRFRIRLVSWVDNLVHEFRRTLYTLAAAVALLLVIACANVANLMLAHASTRAKELAVRAALGAGRARLVRQLLVESLVLAALGMIGGCMLAWFGTGLLATFIPPHAIPDEARIHLNLAALVFSIGAAVATGIAFGLAPAIQASRVDLVDSLKEGTMGGRMFRPGALRRMLVVSEVALSLVLLSGAGLLVRSFAKLRAQELGFDPENLLYIPFALPRGHYDGPGGEQNFSREVLPWLGRLPGVISVAITTSIPPLRSLESPVEIRGLPVREILRTRYDLCSEDYFRTLGLHLRRGRVFSAGEVDAARPVAVVNESFVRDFLGGTDPVGQRFRLGRAVAARGAGDESWFEVVGVIADFRNGGVQEPVQPEVFLPCSASVAGNRAILVRTAANPLAMLPAVQREIWAVDRNVALTESGSVADYIRLNTFAGPRFTLLVLGTFAGVGLVLVALGVYSVVAYIVARRTRDFGLRLAVGAMPGDILKLVFSEALALIGGGMLIGVAASMAVTRVLQHSLWRISPYDFGTLASVSVIVLLAGLGACLVPGLRAAQIDPIIALRHE